MKIKGLFFSGMFFLVFLVGCVTTDSGKIKPLSWRSRQAYIKKSRDPRIFGMDMIQTPAGVEIRGGGRLHERQFALLDMEVKNPLRPVVLVSGDFNVTAPVLLDLVSPLTWMEYKTAQKLDAEAVAETDPILIRLPSEKVAACLSTVNSLRLGQLHIENPLIYVRLASGSIGPLARDIRKPHLKGVIGWDLLHNFGYIQFLYPTGKIALSVSKPYEPNLENLVTTVPLLKNTGACTVKAEVNGILTPLAIDPAGDFFVATSKGATVQSLKLGNGLILSNPEVSVSPGGVRVGARFLRQYLVTICSTPGVVYLETFPDELD